LFIITDQCKTKTNNLDGGILKQQLIQIIIKFTLFEVLTAACLLMLEPLSSSFMFCRTPSAMFCSVGSVRLQGKTFDPPLSVWLFCSAYNSK
jgi:hypothetical protein